MSDDRIISFDDKERRLFFCEESSFLIQCYCKILTPNTTPNIIKERKIQMSKWDKLIARICNLSKDLRFTQLQKVLETYGYRMDAPRSGSSHYTFRKQGKSPITIPKHEPIKKVYVEMVRKVVESEERENENAE